MSGSPQYSAAQVQQLVAQYHAQQTAMQETVAKLQSELAAVQAQQAIRASVNQPSFAVQKVKLDLPPTFDGKPSAMSAWVFAIEQYCMLVGLVSPQDIVKLAVSRLTKDAFTWWRQLTAKGTDYTLGTLGWSDFKGELVDAFQDVDRELKLRRQLQSLRQQTSVAQYTKDFRTIVLELGEQSPDESALLFMYTEGLKPDVQMQVLLARPTMLTEAETIAERADMALFTARRRPQGQQQQQRPRFSQQQQNWSRFGNQRFRFQAPPPPPPRNGPVPMELGLAQGNGQQRQSQLGQNRPSITCYRCGKQGHMARQCRVRVNTQERPQAYNMQPTVGPPQQLLQGPSSSTQYQYSQTQQPMQPQQNWGTQMAQGHMIQQQHSQVQPPSPPQLNFLGGSY